jgi:phosphatidylinositol alpha-1,6-mannosyltransferase
MKSILFITRNFPPLVGGMERLAFESVSALSAQWLVDLIGPRGCLKSASMARSVVEVPHRPTSVFLANGWFQSIRLAYKNRPDLIIGGSGLVAPFIVTAGKISRSRTLCFVHGLDLVADHPVYRRFFLPQLKKIDVLVANSHNTARLAVAKGIDRERIHILHPGVDLNLKHSKYSFFLNYPEAKGRKILLFVGRLLPRKGIVDFVERVLPRVISKHPETLLVIAGGPVSNALTKAGDEGYRLLQLIEHNSLEKHVLLCGFLEDEILASLYNVADLMIFPVKDLPSDVEGFGMVAIEAASQGLPTVAFAAGGISDAVSNDISGSLVPSGDYDQMATVISQYFRGNKITVTPEGCREFAKKFAWPLYAQGLKQICNQRVFLNSDF